MPSVNQQVNVPNRHQTCRQGNLRCWENTVPRTSLSTATREADNIFIAAGRDFLTGLVATADITM